MRIVIVGFPYSGKSTLLGALAGIARDHLKTSEENLAAVKLPDPRLEWLEELFKPRRRTEITLDFVDLPGSTEGEAEHAGLAKHLPTLRQSDGLLVVLRAFTAEAVPVHGGGIDPRRDMGQLRDEMLLADLLICANRLEKLEKAVTKPTRERDQLKHEMVLLQRCQEALERERPLRDIVQPGDEEKLLRSFGFLTQKPLVVVINVGEEAAGQPPAFQVEHAYATFAACATLEAELIQMEAADRPAFMAEYGVAALARDRLVRACFDALGMITFLTGGGKDEVRAWAVPRGSTAVEAAGKIHTDMERGFIRAETVAFDDLKAAGDLRGAKAAGKLRQEPKSYIVQDGDMITFKFNV